MPDFPEVFMINFDITDAAADKLLDVLDLSKNEKLRVFIIGGGCAGFEYGFNVEKNQEEGDYFFEKNKAPVLIDPISGAYLNGAILDYVSEAFSSKFVLKNPNAKSTCGCGNSFTG